jgi:hypothetical protein
MSGSAYRDRDVRQPPIAERGDLEAPGLFVVLLGVVRRARACAVPGRDWGAVRQHQAPRECVGQTGAV